MFLGLLNFPLCSNELGLINEFLFTSFNILKEPSFIMDSKNYFLPALEDLILKKMFFIVF